LSFPPNVFERPQRLNPASGWHRHIPFAFWLIPVARPRRLVELGTHWGDSYFAFCQAAVSSDVSMEAFAVDSWLGDEHAGLYGNEVFEDVRQWNETHFGRFSTLLRMMFDEAVGEFEDGSIDVLHIDGLHTYEAVRHDFDTWRPKLSERGVVLFHDIEERGHGFGVHRLWDELRGSFPGFGFRHGHGLGVLLVGSEPPRSLIQFLDSTGSGEPFSDAVAWFEVLGERVSLYSEVGELKGLLQAHVDDLTHDRASSDPIQMARILDRAELEKHALALEARVDVLVDERSKLESALQAVEGERIKLESALQAVEGERSKLESALQAVERERLKLESALQAVEGERDTARREVDAVSAELEDERRFGMRRWAIDHPWSDRIRLALPQRWGLLNRAMKQHW